METQYSKDGQGVYQTLKIDIDGDKETIFNYLSTTEGIQQWFPQLSFEKKRSEWQNVLPFRGRRRFRNDNHTS